MATYKQTHISADGQERTCAAEPGQCPLNSSDSTSIPHTITIDGEKITTIETTKLHELYETYKHVLDEDPTLTYPQKMSNFIEKCIHTNSDGQWPTIYFGAKSHEILTFCKKVLQNKQLPYDKVLNIQKDITEVKHFLSDRDSSELEFNLMQFLSKYHEDNRENVIPYANMYEQHVMAGVPAELAMNLIGLNSTNTTRSQFQEFIEYNTTNPEYINFINQNIPTTIETIEHEGFHQIKYTHKGKEHNHWSYGEHRPWTQGPASITTYTGHVNIGSSTEPVTIEEYLAHGKYSRPWQDGPVTRTYKTVNGEKIITAERYHAAPGLPHRPYTEGPAVFETNKETGEKYYEYYNYGQLHRPAHLGPAKTYPQTGTGKTITEYWVDGEQLTKWEVLKASLTVKSR